MYIKRYGVGEVLNIDWAIELFHHCLRVENELYSLELEYGALEKEHAQTVERIKCVYESTNFQLAMDQNLDIDTVSGKRGREWIEREFQTIIKG